MLIFLHASLREAVLKEDVEEVNKDMLHLHNIHVKKSKKIAQKEKRKEGKNKIRNTYQLAESKYMVYEYEFALQYWVDKTIPHIGHDFVTFDGPRVSRC